MIVAISVAVLALAAAVCIGVAAVRRHQREMGITPSWGEVKEAFSAHAITGVGREAAMLSDPTVKDTDLGVGDLITLSESGSGYLVPRDILPHRSHRD